MEENVKSLLVIGNGFDAACGLASNFTDFFDNAKVELKNIDDFLKSTTDFVEPIRLGTVGQSTRYMDMPLLGVDSKRNSLLAESIIMKFDSQVGGALGIVSQTQIQSQMGLEALTATTYGFWGSYFNHLNRLPEYWYDVEGILRDFFEDKSSDIGVQSAKPQAHPLTRFEGIQEYMDGIQGICKASSLEDGLHILANISQSDAITQRLAYLLVDVYEFDPSTQTLSELLLNQLKVFEGKFADYLDSEVKQNESYLSNRGKLLDQLSKNMNYNLLNFNYTTPKTEKLQVTRNVHSTLDNGPIFGIDSDNVDADESYYKFTKTYRIMRLATGANRGALLPQSIDKVIFYGHSLSSADYSYFQAIFDYYNLYDENVQLIFYYSKYGTKTAEQVARGQFDAVSGLLDNYGSKIPNKGKNLLHKLLLEDRVKILELK